MWESGISLAVAVLAGVALCGLGWSIILFRIRPHLPAGRTTRWVVAPALWGAVILLLACPLACLLSIVVPGIPVLLLVPVSGLLGFIVLSWAWWRVASVSPQPKVAGLAALMCLLAAVGILFVWLPFLLWALGIIPTYEAALATSVLVGLAVLACGGLGVGGSSYKAATPLP